MAKDQLGGSLKFASIDIGSNAMRLLFCRVVEDPSTVYIKESLIRMPLRLGEDAFVLGKLTEDSIQKLIKTIHAFYLMIQAYDPISFKSCATAALRTASNGQEIVDEINEIINVNLEIISGKEEARIIMANHIEQHLSPDKDYVYIDVGGGSTEISFIANRQKTYSKSFPIGSVRILRDQVKNLDWKQMKNWIIDNRKKIEGNLQAIGSGGNINKIFSMSTINNNNEIDIIEIE